MFVLNKNLSTTAAEVKPLSKSEKENLEVSIVDGLRELDFKSELYGESNSHGP